MNADSEIAQTFLALIAKIKETSFARCEFIEDEAQCVCSKYDFLHEILNAILCERYQLIFSAHVDSMYSVRLKRYRDYVHDESMIKDVDILHDSFVFVFGDIEHALAFVAFVTRHAETIM